MTSTPRRSGVVLIVVGMLAVLLLMMAFNLRATHCLWRRCGRPSPTRNG
nr:hypothetical protein [Candidatus Symbiopectobacterium sp.]